MLGYSPPKGLNSVEGTPSEAACEELQPMGRTHIEVCGELSPMGGTALWNRRRRCCCCLPGLLKGIQHSFPKCLRGEDLEVVVGLRTIGWWLDLVSKVSSNFNNSMILKV